MNIKYFQETDTLYIEFRKGEVAETRDLDENTLLDVDRDGNIVAMTMEHARQRADIPQFSFEQVVASHPCARFTPAKSSARNFSCR